MAFFVSAGRSLSLAASTALGPSTNDTRKQPAAGAKYTTVLFFFFMRRDQPYLAEDDFHSSSPTDSHFTIQSTNCFQVRALFPNDFSISAGVG